ncbi:MAG: alpha-N-acetylglucosaminidase [Bacteroidaceae bacterium]|nr:alpha-N-acetylglucosaminidase [Bacteroidaceae bacterium]
MKRNFLLTAMLGLLCITTGWAQFAPDVNKVYALKETSSGLYLDIQTKGIDDPNISDTDNVSLNARPCLIYFEAGSATGKWKMRNAKGEYVCKKDGWNATVGNGSVHEWIFDGNITALTIASEAGKYFNVDNKAAGQPMFCDKGTGMTFSLEEYTTFPSYALKSPYSGVAKGAIQTSADLNAITTPTKIIVQSFSDTNNYFFAGASNVQYINQAVLVWEPVTEGTPGTYYLRTTDAENGYIQASTGANAAITLGTKTNAQVFVTTAPTTSGSNATYFNGESLDDGVDGQVAATDKLVRFVQQGGTTWLNVNSSGAKPRLGNNGKGAYTVHNVFLVTDVTTYLNLTTVNTTAASMQATPTNFNVIPLGGTYLLQNRADASQYVGYTTGNTRDANTSASAWKILTDEDADGFAQIARSDDATKRLGSDEECVVNKGVYTNVGDGCNGWYFEGIYSDYATVGSESGGKYNFTSGWIYIAGPCNKIRFTLTESAAFYSNGAKRLSFDSFVLYDADGSPVTIKAENITGNNGKVYDEMLDGTDGTYTAGTWQNASATDDWFEITLDNNVELGGAFKFSFVTENTTMNATEFEIKMSYEEPSGYTFAVNAPADKDYSATYNGKAIAHGDIISLASFNEALLAATEIEGYTWKFVVDDNSKTITLVYTVAPDVINPAAVVALINRIGGDGTDAKFKFVLSPSLNSKSEVFVISSEDGKILIKGTTISAITTGIGWYLQNIAHINIAWNSLNEKTVSGAAYADLSSIPVPTVEETRTSDAMYRYYLNTCAFGYSMTSWTWKRWQQEIDWMALHGINMPLQLVGMEEVWRSFLTMEDGNGNRKYGYTDTEAKRFVAGPAFIAWWAMNNLEGWGGTAAGTKSGGTWDGAGGVQDDAWYARQKNLAKLICGRQRELGMQPVLPGWSGMVPTDFESQSGFATRGNGGNWAGDFVRPLLLNVSNANYADIAADYYKCLNDVMGGSQYYSMDPFHEGGGAGTMEDYEALYAAMEAAMPGSKWVIQQWQWSATQRYALTAVPAGRLVVLDLFSDGSPAFDSYGGYTPQDAVFCAIPNFGGRSGLMGRLTNLANNYFLYKGKYPSSIKGIGAAPEAIEQTPVTYDLIFQLPWMGEKPDVAKWVENYATARYGAENEVVHEAWELLRQGPLNYGADGIQGPVEDVWAARPNLDANKASYWGKTLTHAQGTYTKARQQMLIDATFKLLTQSESLGFTAGDGSVYESNYYYDLVEFGGAVLADYAYYLLLGIKEAKNASNTALYEERRDAFLQLILDVDRFKGTNLNFRLGKWTQEARAAADEVKGATSATPDWYEYNNARTIISTWSSPNTNLNDYSYRSWQGLMKDLYYPRWKHYFDNNCTSAEYGFFEWNWAHGRVHSVGQTAVSDVYLTEGQTGHTSSYKREPEGNTIDVAKEVLGKYIIPVVADDGKYYAYRHLSNDMTAICTVVAEPGATIDLSSYFGELTDVTITGDFIDGTATDIKNVTIKADATDGSHAGTITLSDGTELSFAVVINPAYNGVYRIYYQNSGDIPVFVGYNEDEDNSKNIGYKLIAEGTYSSVVETDKLFTIVPQSTGYSLSAQGQYMKAPTLAGWNHICFSDNGSDAGVYLFEETGEDTGIFKIRSVGSGINYLNDYNKLVFGNDNSDKEGLATFKFTKVNEYTVNVPAEGYKTLYLPFNVVLPTGVTAYTVLPSGIMNTGEGYGYKMNVVATAGQTLLKGTPVIIKAAAGDYTFGVTVDNTNAKTVTSSAMRGTYFAKTVKSSSNAKRYAVTVVDEKVVFDRIDAETEIAANSAWLETIVDVETIGEYDGVKIVDGGVYRIAGLMSDGMTMRTLYTNGSGGVIRWTADAKDDASTLFIAQKQDNGSYKFVSALANGLWNEEAKLTEEGTELYFVDGTQENTYTIYAKINGSNPRSFAVIDDGTINYYTNYSGSEVKTEVSNTITTDFILQVADASLVNFTVGFDAMQEWATMYLPFAVTVPDGVEACFADDIAEDVHSATITVERVGAIVPAYTPVLLNRNSVEQAREVVFNYTAESAVKPTNIFKGRLITSAVSAAGKNCYLLFTFGGAGAFYWVYSEYNENLEFVSPGSNEGGYIKCEANKAYLALDAVASPSARYSFRFEGETTGIDEITGENGAEKSIFDLQGRKLNEITAPGIYIVNGEKVLIK